MFKTCNHTHTHTHTHTRTHTHTHTHTHTGVVEVFGSWKKVAPHLGGPHIEAEQVERQLAEAMCEQDSPPTVTVVAGGSGAKTGFFPLDGSH